MTSRDDWLARVAAIRRWSRGGARAPHKPLLLLYALGRLRREGSSSVPYVEAEPALDHLLREFGPATRRTSPAYPFARLQNDGLWVVEEDGPLSDSRTQLRAGNAVGSLDPQFETALRNDPVLVALIARSLLDDNFAESLHRDICALVGLDLESIEVEAARGRAVALRRRDPAFRNAVLVAYEYQCAMCGYDGRLGTEAVGLEAAHVQWWAFNGPDTVDNGLSLCTFHHKLLDRGALGLASDRTIAVSTHFVGRGHAADELVLRLAGAPLLAPQRGQEQPADAHIDWHAEQVFRGPARVAA